MTERRRHYYGDDGKLVLCAAYRPRPNSHPLLTNEPGCVTCLVCRFHLQMRGVLPIDDDCLRGIWRRAGGEFHGPNVETGTMPEAILLPFLRGLITRARG